MYRFIAALVACFTLAFAGCGQAQLAGGVVGTINGTFTGQVSSATSMTISPPSGIAQFYINSAAGQQSAILFQNTGANRWQMGKNTDDTFFFFDAQTSKTPLIFPANDIPLFLQGLLTNQVYFPKIAATGTAPGAALMKLEVVAGTNAGTCKIIAYAGTSATPTTLLDNVGAGC
jgi:hypothetical protein